MFTHLTGIGRRDRREKGRTNKPKLYLFVEFALLAVVMFVISLFEIKFITVLVALVAIYVFIMSCLPRYAKIMKRQ
ncbi:MAG TPA: hypothetical protein EYG82_06160 [Sulfurovum sp.]|nr:hypothetical protein [Sulfurovum sp.]